jgi:putative transposase
VGRHWRRGAKGWLNHLSDLKNRGVEDILLVACDGLKGLPDAITALWPHAQVQQCVVHLVRASLRYASKQLKTIYTGPTVDAAEAAFTEFSADWEENVA